MLQQNLTGRKGRGGALCCCRYVDKFPFVQKHIKNKKMQSAKNIPHFAKVKRDRWNLKINTIPTPSETGDSDLRGGGGD